jgi:hypothetical protein
LKNHKLLFPFGIFLIICLAISPAVLADEAYSSLPCEKLIELSACADMKTMNDDCGSSPKKLSERERVLEAGLEDLWALNYGEKSPLKVREAARMIRGLARMDLGVLIKNPTFARATLLRGEVGIRYLLSKDQSDPSTNHLRLTKAQRDKIAKFIRKVEQLYTEGKYEKMRLQLYETLWLTNPLTTNLLLPDPNQRERWV